MILQKLFKEPLALSLSKCAFGLEASFDKLRTNGPNPIAPIMLCFKVKAFAETLGLRDISH